MTRTRSTALVWLGALAAAACAAAPALSQEPPLGSPPGEPGRMGEHGHWAERMAETAQARAKALHAILNLRPDQEPALQAFLAAMKPPMPLGEERGPGGQGPMAGPMTEMTTPQRLDMMAARMARGQAEFQRRAEAIKGFYAALSPQQQRAFDALQTLRGEGPGREDGPPRHPGFGGPDEDGPR